MNTPELPQRIFSVSGKLRLYEPENNPTHLSSRMVVRDDEGKVYFLNAGDVVFTKEWLETVIRPRGDNEYLNGKMGMLFTRKEADEVLEAQIQNILQRMKNPDPDVARQIVGPGLHHYFISFPPQERAGMEKWIDAFEAETEVRVQFRIPPFAVPSEKYVAGLLEPFHEQGMEDNIGWAVVDAQQTGYDALHLLAEGDYLIIYSKNGHSPPYWQGLVTAAFLETLNNQIKKWYNGPKNPTPEGEFLTRAFAEKFPAVLIKR